MSYQSTPWSRAIGHLRRQQGLRWRVLLVLFAPGFPQGTVACVLQLLVTCALPAVWYVLVSMQRWGPE